MAIAPERREVLSRLGIFKAGTEDVFPRPLQSLPQLDGASTDDAAESFPTESSSSPVFARVVSGLQSRTAILLLIAVAAAAAVGALVIFKPINFGSIAAALTPTSVATATDSPAPAAETLSTKSVSVKKPIPSRSALIAAPPRQRSASVSTPGSAIATSAQASDAPKPLPSQVTAELLHVGERLRALSSSGDEAETVTVDETIYSKDDEDVVPPRLLSEELPSPTIGGWTTRTNVIEVIVSEAGAVERARFVAIPQRMPDMFVLSRAKVWKFTPAMKDGQPVRYRILLSWEVNP